MAKKPQQRIPHSSGYADKCKTSMKVIKDRFLFRKQQHYLHRRRSGTNSLKQTERITRSSPKDAAVITGLAFESLALGTINMMWGKSEERIYKVILIQFLKFIYTN